MNKEEKIKAWDKHYSQAKEKEFYSIKRIDILTISISGACIFTTFQILKFMHSPETSNLCSNTTLLKVSAFLSVVAIIINFASQITGYHANKFEAIYSQEVLNQIKENEENKSKLEQIDKKSNLYNKLTSLSIPLSALFMSLGIITLVIFNLITY